MFNSEEVDRLQDVFGTNQLGLMQEMAKQRRVKAKRRGRPVTTGKGLLVGVRCHKEFLDHVDAWRAKQERELSRPAAIHRLAEIGLRVGGR
jgi:hypothetical protein